MDILIIDDESTIRNATQRTVQTAGHYAETAANLDAARLSMKETSFDLIFLDVRLREADGIEYLQEILQKKPHQLVIIFTAYSSIELAVKATQAGAFDYLEKPFTPDRVRGVLLKAQNALSAQQKINKLENHLSQLKEKIDHQEPPSRLESQDLSTQETLETLFRAAQTSASILLLGESGTGKSIIARSIHESSHLADQPFVTVSCPSLSKDLLESELFGHVKGAFTGAIKDSKGKVNAADGGTLFLDEIGELPLEIQPKLLRLLQEKEYERVGSAQTHKANVRIITATNRDLQAAVKTGTFREDLYYRINVITAELPALRERAIDLMTFANDYLDFFSAQIGRKIQGFSKDAMELIQTYQWPGNFRELRNTVERAAILCRENFITPTDLPWGSSDDFSSLADTGLVQIGGEVTLQELEEEHIRRILESSNSLHEAAQILGIDKATLYRKRKKMDLA